MTACAAVFEWLSPTNLKCKRVSVSGLCPCVTSRVRPCHCITDQSCCCLATLTTRNVFFFFFLKKPQGFNSFFYWTKLKLDNHHSTTLACIIFHCRCIHLVIGWIFEGSTSCILGLPQKGEQTVSAASRAAFETGRAGCTTVMQSAACGAPERPSFSASTSYSLYDNIFMPYHTVWVVIKPLQLVSLTAPWPC